MIHRLLFPVALGVLCAPAWAGPVTLTVENIQGSEGGYGFSAVHSADGAAGSVGGNLYYMGGALFVDRPVTGTFLGELDGNILTIDSGFIDGYVSGPNAGQITVSGGVIDLQTAGQMDSYLDTSVGTFHFLTHNFAGPANSIVPVIGGNVRLWGNNWNNTLQTRAEFEALGGYALGIDLGLAITDRDGTTTTTVVPEPSTWALFGLGTLALAGITRRRRRRIEFVGPVA